MTPLRYTCCTGLQFSCRVSLSVSTVVKFSISVSTETEISWTRNAFERLMDQASGAWQARGARCTVASHYLHGVLAGVSCGVRFEPCRTRTLGAVISSLQHCNPNTVCSTAACSDASPSRAWPLRRLGKSSFVYFQILLAQEKGLRPPALEFAAIPSMLPYVPKTHYPEVSTSPHTFGYRHRQNSQSPRKQLQ